jgi:hypothetical protein
MFRESSIGISNLRVLSPQRCVATQAHTVDGGYRSAQSCAGTQGALSGVNPSLSGDLPRACTGSGSSASRNECATRRRGTLSIALGLPDLERELW